MTDIKFSKWQGTGNDFIILDNRDNQYDTLPAETIKYLCHRNFGIGADGLIKLEIHPQYDFSMKYYNADGNEAEMCGNGARCIIGFAYELGIIENETQFMASDGIHEGEVVDNNLYQVKMIDVEDFRKSDDYYFLNTGVPHAVIFTDDIIKAKIVETGRKIRNSSEFAPEGTNVNFVQIDNNNIKLRTYERGVENETLSCGTGAVASAIAASLENGQKQTDFNCQVLGGILNVSFEFKGSGAFKNIFLQGPAYQVFEGTLRV